MQEFPHHYRVTAAATVAGDVTLGSEGVADIVSAPPREFDVLHTLALEPRRVFSVDELLRQVWGAEFIGQPQVVYVHIRWLREKIESYPNSPQRLVTVRGVGYKLEPQGD